VPELQVFRTRRFEQEARELLGPDRYEAIVAGLEWTLRRSAASGQRVRGTDLQVYPLFLGGGFAFLAYYRVSGARVTLESLAKRQAPVSPQLLDLED